MRDPAHFHEPSSPVQHEGPWHHGADRDDPATADPRGSRRDLLRVLHQRLARTEQHVHDLIGPSPAGKASAEPSAKA